MGADVPLCVAQEARDGRRLAQLVDVEW
jgi:hypothetical protein